MSNGEIHLFELAESNYGLVISPMLEIGFKSFYFIIYILCESVE